MAKRSTAHSVAVLLTVGVAFLSMEGRAVELAGTEVTLEWAPAGGAVAGYYVVVVRDNQAAELETITSENRAQLEGEVGETVVVQVAAFGPEGNAGPLSRPSEPIKFTNEPSGEAFETPRVRGDFTGDGRSDLFVQEGRLLRIWALDGARLLGAIPLPLAPEGAEVVAVADTDGNGTADLVWEDIETGSLELWQLDGGVLVGILPLERAPVPRADGWQIAGAEDLDGIPGEELVWFSAARGELEAWSLDAFGVVARERVAGRTEPWAPHWATTAGVPTLIWQNAQSGSLESEASDGLVRPLGAPQPGWSWVGAADGAGSGSAELLLADAASTSLVGWIPSTGETREWVPLDGRALVAVGDFDGDGTEDLALQDPDGTITILLSGTGVEATLARRLEPSARILSDRGR